MLRNFGSVLVRKPWAFPLICGHRANVATSCLKVRVGHNSRCGHAKTVCDGMQRWLTHGVRRKRSCTIETGVLHKCGHGIGRLLLSRPRTDHHFRNQLIEFDAREI